VANRPVMNAMIFAPAVECGTRKVL